jgi:hypothetical protein
MLGDDSGCWALRSWARNVRTIRARTVLESHLEHWFAGFSALPPKEACARLAASAARELRPAPGETVGEKVGRTRRAVRNAFVRRVEHDETLPRPASDDEEAEPPDRAHP